MVAPALAPTPDRAADYEVTMWSWEGPVQHIGIQALDIDGTLVPPEDLDFDEQWRYGETSHRWFLKSGDDPASMRFRARRATLVFEPMWGPQQVEVRRNGETILEERTEPGHARIKALDVPQRQPSPIWLLVFSVAAAAAAAVIRPWAGERRVAAWLVFYAFGLQLAFWLSQPIGAAGDSVGYLTDSRALGAALRPSYFPPGYPLFLWSLRWSGGSLLAVATLAQAALSTLCAWWIFRLLRTSFGVQLAFWASLVAASCPTLLGASRSLLAETVTATTMLGAAYYGFQHRQSGRAIHGVVAGLFAAAAGAVRIFPVVILLPLFAALHLRRPFARNFRRALIPIGVPLVMALVPLVGLRLLNPDASPLPSAGGHLYNSVVEAKHLWNPDGEVTRQYADSLINEFGRPRSQFAMRDLLLERGLSTSEAQSVMGSIAWEGISARPFAYLWATVEQTWNQLVWKPWTPWHPHVSYELPELRNPTTAALSQGAIEWRWTTLAWQEGMWTGLVLLFAAGALLALFRPEPAGFLVLGSMPLGLACVVSLLEHGAAAYSTIHAQALVACAVAGAGSALAIVARNVHKSLLVLSDNAWAGWALASAIGLLACAWLGNEALRVVLDQSQLLGLRDEVRGWSTPAPPLAADGRVPLAPAGTLLLGPLVGWPPAQVARWLWLAVHAISVVWVVRWCVRTSSATTPLLKTFAALLPLAMFAPAAAMGHGRIAVPMLALVLAGLSIAQREQRWSRDLAIGAILTACWMAPLFALPFAWVLWFRGRARAVGLGIAGTALLTLWVAIARDQGPLEPIAQWWNATWAAVENRPRWLVSLDYRGPIGWASAGLWLLLGAWTWQHRGRDPWVLAGAAALAARLGTYHTWYDDVLLLLPMVALWRISRSEAPRAPIAGYLAAALWISTIAPGGHLVLPWPWAPAWILAQAALWLGALAYLLLEVGQTAAEPQRDATHRL